MTFNLITLITQMKANNNDLKGLYLPSKASELLVIFKE